MIVESIRRGKQQLVVLLGNYGRSVTTLSSSQKTPADVLCKKPLLRYDNLTDGDKVRIWLAFSDISVLLALSLLFWSFFLVRVLG